MSHYVDGFVLPIPTKNLNSYRRIAKVAAKVWLEHGALEYRECVGDDLEIKEVLTFPQMVKPKVGETIVFAWIVYNSRAHRDRVNAKVMKDPRLMQSMDLAKGVFDCKRMAYGGFKTIVEG